MKRKNYETSVKIIITEEDTVTQKNKYSVSESRKVTYERRNSL